MHRHPQVERRHLVRELHVVAVSEDGRHVLLGGKRGATKGGFRVALDDRLLAAVRGDLPRPGEDPHAAPELSPKEIQSRLRAGESAESIASSAGVPVLRVERFSGPVQGEMARIIDAARSAYLVRGRLGRSALPLGAAVDAALAQAPSLRPESVEWETHREADGSWLVTVSWFARARTRAASWSYHPPTKAVTAADPTSAALGHRDPDASGAPPKRRTPAVAPEPTRPARKLPAKKVAKASKASKAPAKKAARAPAKRATTRAPAKKAPAKRAAAKAPARRATKTPAKKASSAKIAVTKRAVTPPPAKKAPARKAPAAKAARVLRVVPDPTPRRKPKTAAERDGVTSRAAVPAWADVLLGTSPGGKR
jgi:hypothetical protein